MRWVIGGAVALRSSVIGQFPEYVQVDMGYLWIFADVDVRLWPMKRSSLKVPQHCHGTSSPKEDILAVGKDLFPREVRLKLHREGNVDIWHTLLLSRSARSN